MAVRHDKIIDTNIVSAVAAAGNVSYLGATPKRISVYVKLSLNGAPTPDLTLSVQVSPDAGLTAITYDKLINDTGTDTPVATVVYLHTGSFPAFDILSASIEDVIDWLQVTLTPSAAGNLGATIFYHIEVWLVTED